MNAEQRSLRDLRRHLRAVVPHGDELPESQWRSRHRALVWLLRAHIPAIFVLSLGFDQGFWQAVLDGATVTFFAVLAHAHLGGRRAQAFIVTVGLLSCSALVVHITSGLNQSYFHFFVMVAALSVYEDWFPFAIAVVYVLVQQGITAEIVDYDKANSPWKWALVHSAFVGALSLVCLATWRASERDRAAFRTLVESLEEGVVMIDRAGTLVAANPSASRILGTDPAEVLAKDADLDWTVVDGDGVPMARREIPLVVTARTGEPQVGVTLGLRHKRGGEGTRWLSVSTRAVEDDPDGPYTVVVSFTDITEEREAADALERSNAELQQFAYVASHDLSEPLRMVSSYLSLLRRRYHGRLDADADEFIEYAVDGAARMRTLIEGLLEYSRAGRGDEPAERVELALVAADVLRSLAAAMIEASAEVEIGRLPAVMGNRGQLEQLLQNLIANALKFRTGRARVWVHAEETGNGMAQIAVADGGIGIAPEARDHVFEMFQRLHDRETYEGTGIGLAICRKIVERHGGRIWVDEREGGGTVFRFTLPVA